MVHHDYTRARSRYIPPYLSPEERKVLRDLGIATPDRKLTSNSLTFTVPH